VWKEELQELANIRISTKFACCISFLFFHPLRLLLLLGIVCVCVVTMLRSSIDRGDRTVQEGELVVLFGGRERIIAVTTKKGALLNHKFGHFRHDDIIGM
jgi:hypothetical protein